MSSIDPEQIDLKSKWLLTRQLRFAALAIGGRPHDPPPWAVLACMAEYNREMSKTQRGNNSARDGWVLDEVIRIFFEFEDTARCSDAYSPSTYSPPTKAKIIQLALLRTEGITKDSELFRSRFQAVERRLTDEEEDENLPERASDGARQTRRYKRILEEWGRDEVGAPRCVHSDILYLNELIDGDDG